MKENLELPGKMAAEENVALASFHNHIKITTNLQNNHHSETPEIWPNASPTTRELATPRLVGEAEMGMRWSHTHNWWIKIGRSISATEAC